VTEVIGGDRLAVASAEYQYYVTPSWRAALFVDGGNAFDGDDFDPEVGAGFGVHYVSPVGAIRLDLGRNVSEDDPSWRLHITLGAEF
jgi:translocation and assembly module TamA